jgi:hypothetical protein
MPRAQACLLPEGARGHIPWHEALEPRREIDAFVPLRREFIACRGTEAAAGFEEASVLSILDLCYGTREALFPAENVPHAARRGRREGPSDAKGTVDEGLRIPERNCRNWSGASAPRQASVSRRSNS